MKNTLKGLLKTATQIIKIGDVKNILGNDNYIGTGYFGVKRGVIKVLDNLYSKRSEEVKELDYNRLVPTTISGEYEEVKEINIKVNTTQVVSESFLVYLNTSYYLFFSNYIKDLKMYVKSPVDPIILANKNNEVLGIVLPLRLKYELVLIPNNNIIAQNNILVDLKNIEIINGKELDLETRDITRQLQFDYYKKGLHAKYSYTRLNKLGFKLSHKNFEEAQTLEDYKKELEIKEQNKIKNNEYLQKLANEYIEYHNKSLSANKDNFNNIVDYNIEKINKSTYIVQCIDNNNNKIGYFRLNMLNCDVKLTEQKQIFKMIKEYLVNSTLELQTIEDNKINDLKVEEVATTKEDIKEMLLNENELNKIVNDIVVDMQEENIINIEIVENNIKCEYMNKYQDEKTCYFYKSNNKSRVQQVYNKLIDILDPCKSFDSFTTDKELLKGVIATLENRLINIDNMIQKFLHDENTRLAYRYIENDIKYTLAAATEILEGLEDNKETIQELETNLYTDSYDIDEVNKDIKQYNKEVKQIKSVNRTDILENYIKEHKQSILDKIETIQHENNVYNLNPIKIIEVETGIKKAYFDSKRNSYKHLLETKENNCYYYQYLNTYKVYTVMIFDNLDYEKLVNNLMYDIKAISGKGGSGEGINHYCILATTPRGEKGILIDPQGYNYARYTGIVEPEEVKQVLNTSIISA